jgi:hypothetical protein
MSKYQVTDTTGIRVEQGDTVTDFRGETAEFYGVERGPSAGKSAKVRTSRGTFYDKVFGLTVTENQEA